MRKRNPFVRSIGKPVKVFTDAENVGVYFLSTGSIDGNTNPIDIQEGQRKEAELGAILLDAVDNLATQKGISREDARQYFQSREINGSTVAALNPIDYLSSDERVRFFTLSQDAQELPERVATVFCQHRLLYTIHILQDVPISSNLAFISEPWFDVQVGQVFKFEQTTLKVVSPYNPNTGTIGIQSISTHLAAQSEGHLLKPNGKEFVTGDPGWSDEQTKELSVMSSSVAGGQIQAIYQFYLKEAGRLTDTVDTEMGESQNQNLENSQTVPASIGENSTGSVVTTESQTSMNGSESKTLVLAQNG